MSVVAGGADTACALSALQASGLAPNRADTVVVNVGTGVQIIRPGVTPTPRDAPVSHLYADADGGWYEMLAVQNGGLALSWCQDVLGLDWDSFVALAATARARLGGTVVRAVPGGGAWRTGRARTPAPGGSAAPGRPDERSWRARRSRRWPSRSGAASSSWGPRTPPTSSSPVVVRGIRGCASSSQTCRAAPSRTCPCAARPEWARPSWPPARSGSTCPSAAEVVEVPASPSPALEDAYGRWLRAVEAMAAYTGMSTRRRRGRALGDRPACAPQDPSAPRHGRGGRAVGASQHDPAVGARRTTARSARHPRPGPGPRRAPTPDHPLLRRPPVAGRADHRRPRHGSPPAPAPPGHDRPGAREPSGSAGAHDLQLGVRPLPDPGPAPGSARRAPCGCRRRGCADCS